MKSTFSFVLGSVLILGFCSAIALASEKQVNGMVRRLYPAGSLGL
jgi:hypothetical protein